MFYKFRPYSAKAESEERGSVRQTLFENRVRFTKASQLNDPFEGKPGLVPQHKDPAKQSAAIYATLLDDAHREGLTGDAAERQAKFEHDAMFASGVPAEIYQRLFEESIEESFWVYSVCATREPILMSSHYADGHGGLALHFDPHSIPFDRLFKVHYARRYPTYPFPASGSVASKKAAEAMLYTKSRGWSYEKEYRAIRVLAPGDATQLAWRGMGVQWDGQIAVLSDSALRGVTLGAAMPAKVATDLTAELAERRPTLEVGQALTSRTIYTLEFRRIR